MGKVTFPNNEHSRKVGDKFKTRSKVHVEGSGFHCYIEYHCEVTEVIDANSYKFKTIEQKLLEL